MAEITEAKYRGTLTASGTTCVIIGILTQFVFGTFLPWRTIAVICTALPIATITALHFVPESPYWLISKNRIDDAKKSLAWLRGWTIPDHIDDEFMDIYQSILHKKRQVTMYNGKESRIKPYTRRTFLIPFVIVHLTMFIGCFCGKTTLQTYAIGVSFFFQWKLCKRRNFFKSKNLNYFIINSTIQLIFIDFFCADFPRTEHTN